MNKHELAHDPFNLIITGVGGQGNVLASRLVGAMLVLKDFHVTIGETYGLSQRGGSVMSHVRVSPGGGVAPRIPKGGAHMVAALEPTEALRVLMDYGNPDVRVLSNTRPVYPVGVTAGTLQYPDADDITKWMEELTAECKFIAAADEALKLGSPVLGNAVMIGALSGFEGLPLDRDSFESVIGQSMSADKIELNMKAFDLGVKMVADD